VLLEMPFIGMDDGAFHLVRSLLRQHPKLYGSAVGAMVRRMAPKR